MRAIGLAMALMALSAGAADLSFKPVPLTIGDFDALCGDAALKPDPMPRTAACVALTHGLLFGYAGNSTSVECITALRTKHNFGDLWRGFQRLAATGNNNMPIHAATTLVLKSTVTECK